MKALVLAAVLATLSSVTLAGAAHDFRAQGVTDTRTAAVIADAGRLGSASLAALDGGSGRWTPAQHRAEPDADVAPLAAQVDGGTLLIVLAVLGLAAARPLSRALRRQEQQRRATALASTLGHATHG